MRDRIVYSDDNQPHNDNDDADSFDMTPLRSSRPISDSMMDLFQHIEGFVPAEIELVPVLKCFIPDYVPTIGDIDAMVSIPRPLSEDGPNERDLIGIQCLDEPSLQQSDPTVLGLQLRAHTKSIPSSALRTDTVSSIDGGKLRKDPRPIEQWIQGVTKLRESQPAIAVNYSRALPDVETLMQVWPTEFEEVLKNVKLPSADVDLPLSEYCRLISVLLDVPCPKSSNSSMKTGAKQQSGKPSSTIIESLHLIFTLYSEFKNSQHFSALSNDSGSKNPECLVLQESPQIPKRELSASPISTKPYATMTSTTISSLSTSTKEAKVLMRQGSQQGTML